MDIVLIVIVFLIPTLAFIYLKSNYKKYRKFNSKINASGYKIANHLLTQNGLEYVGIEKIDGELKDNYSVGRKIIYLSDKTYNNTSIASISIATFECAHAVQDVKGNTVLKLRAFFYPIIKLVTTFSYWILIFGFVLHWDEIFYAGVGITMVGLLFNIIFLYCEFDASKKALSYLKSFNLIATEEETSCKNILKAYCFKYIAEMMTNSLRFIDLIFVKEDNNEINNVNNK